MRIAIQSYGGIRCAFRDKHLENFIKTFPEIFNEDNEVDVFLMTTYEDKRAVLQHTKESIEKGLADIFGNYLKKLVFFEDVSEEVKQKEDQICEGYFNCPDKHYLNHDEIYEYQNALQRGMFIFQNTEHLYPYAHSDAYNKMNITNELNFYKDGFVPRYYYRRYLVNKVRNDWEKENGKKYDWVITARMFDFDYDKRKPLDFLYSSPTTPIVYSSIDNMVITTPDIMDKIFQPFSEKYPVVGYEQYFHPRLEDSRGDNYAFFIRDVGTYSSEQQLLWQCVSCCDNNARLNIGGNQRKELFPGAYFYYTFCEQRHK